MACLLKSDFLVSWSINRFVHKVENNQNCVYRVNCLPIRGRPRYRPFTRRAPGMYTTGIATWGKNRIARRYFRPDHHRAAIRRPLAPRGTCERPFRHAGNENDAREMRWQTSVAQILTLTTCQGESVTRFRIAIRTMLTWFKKIWFSMLNCPTSLCPFKFFIAKNINFQIY